MGSERIKIYRNILGLTQTDLAKKLDISLQSYWKKEKGIVNFTDKEKLILRDFLKTYYPGITIDEIFFKENALKK
ncbi:helix-turn-helix transcriptional regulator [Facklamia sp. P13069]|uniref:helix-turn-helix transcriptional regulator n=1 Tax=Facklamia sp. P13069 TaxID=3421954 RepID=UPI003D1840E6